ncbi:MAG: hypothetical protein L0I24_22580 [Pseudonocardia sp.]|nr:hypothetical protein [Pseudonocardia sp.]
MSLARQYDNPCDSPARAVSAPPLHAELDAAVLDAYGFSTDDDLLLTQLRSGGA